MRINIVKEAALLEPLNSDTEEDRLTARIAAREQLTRTKFRAEAASIDELARDLERLPLDRASPNLAV